MHPDCSEVIPFMLEHIVNSDGGSKQDCGAPRGVHSLVGVSPTRKASTRCILPTLGSYLRYESHVIDYKGGQFNLGFCRFFEPQERNIV